VSKHHLENDVWRKRQRARQKRKGNEKAKKEIGLDFSDQKGFV
jgi:hypothetical protein